VPPVRLDGRWIDLVPLEPAHRPALAEAGRDPEIWRFLRYGDVTTDAAMDALISELLARQRRATDLAFTIVRRSDGTPVGMTRFLEIARDDRAVEIGGSWLARSCWRSPFNSDAKRLLLGYAFDTEQALRVAFKTDLRNTRSQRAIERLGAHREGVLRDHIRLPDGVQRSSVVYSIVAPEWPAVRERLDAALRRPWPPTTVP